MLRALSLAALLAASPAMAHSGGTDANGCHNSSSGYHCHNGGGGGGGGVDDSADTGVDGALIVIGILALVGIVIGIAVVGASSGRASNDVLVCVDNGDCADGYICSGDMCRPSAVSTIKVGPTGLGVGFSW